MFTAGKPARPLPAVESCEQMRFAGGTACATSGKSVARIGGAGFSLPTPACGRILPHLRRSSPVLQCVVAQALVPAASALMPTLDAVSQQRVSVETSLDTAGTSACATSSVNNAG